MPSVKSMTGDKLTAFGWLRVGAMASLLAMAAFAVAALYSPPDPANAQFQHGANQAPVIAALPTDLTIAENATGNVGSPFTATDADAGDTITWSVGGADGDQFSISAGQLSVKSATGLNYEDGATPSVTVTASDGTGGTDSEAVTVTVTDVREPPGRPAAPMVAVDANSPTTSTVTWSAPTNTGPPITRYYIRYCLDSTGCDVSDEWSSHPSTADTTATIANLREGKTYQVRVRAKSDEGQSPWSAIGTGAASADDDDLARAASSHDPPVIDGLPNQTITVAENTTGNIGSAFTATPDPPDADITWSLGGTDADSFDISADGGQLSLASGVSLDYETKTSYAITVTATVTQVTDETDSIAVTVTVTDVDEVPDKPELKIVSIIGNRVRLEWEDPTNVGSAIQKFNLRYRKADRYYSNPDPTWKQSDYYETTGNESIVIPSENVKYEHQLRAVNGAGQSEWSDSIYYVTTSPTTGNLRPTIHTRSVTGLEISEKMAGAAVGAPIMVTEPDAGDTLTWSLSRSAAAAFAISSDGQLSVAAADGLDYYDGAFRNLRVTVSDGTDSDSENVAVKVNFNPCLAATKPWSATLTAGTAPTNTGTTGYNASDDDNEVFGTLDSTTFTVDGIAYTVVQLATGNDLVFELDKSPIPLRSLGVSLCIGSDTYAFKGTSTLDNQVYWFGSDNEWDTTKAFVDGTTYSVALALGPPMTPNTTPVISGPDPVAITVAENATGNVGSPFKATDEDAYDPITWSVGGTTAVNFAISNRGQLSVTTGLDYESAPTHSLTVTATDGNGGTDTVAVTVTVTDVYESPVGPPADCLVTDLLCATLTAGEASGSTGYDRGNYGTLSDTDFVHDRVTYTIEFLKESGQVNLRLDPNTVTPPDSLTLYIDNDVYPFSDAYIINIYWAVLIDWESLSPLTAGQTYKVRIIGPPKPPGKMDAPTAEYIGSRVAYDEVMGTVKVTWELPEIPDLGIPLAHKLELRTRRADFKSSESWWIRELDADATATTHSLLLNQTAAFQVRLVNALWSVPPCTMATRHTCAYLEELATGYGPWSDTGYGKAALPCPDCPNNPPVITTAKTMTIAENTPGNFGPVRPRNNGTIRVDDADYDPITWSVGGEHGDLFNISTAEYGHGQLSVASATGLNYEDTGSIKGTYLRVFFVTLTASDGKDSDSYDIYVEVLDRAEAPGQPGAPTVTSVAKSNASLIVTWDAPTNTGPPITGYELQYKKTSESSWTPKSHTGTGVTATITGLDANTEYQVQVRASNDEATGSWSDSGEGTTVETSAANQAPVIGGPDSVTITVAENKPDNIGSAFTATDGDAIDTIIWSVGGAAGHFFNISSAGRLSAKSATGLDYEEGVILQLTVIASDGTDSDSVAVTVRVSDVDEAPGQPNAPALQSPGSSDTAMRVWWNVPANTGPAITGYEVQYRASSMPKSPPSGPWSIYKPEGTGTMTTITGLIAGTNWEVQVRAANAEGAGDWSASSYAWTSGLTPGG